ncbi:MAG: hypothetical protein ACR2G4_17085 [Pyrinomonadaceae bacterium]
MARAIERGVVRPDWTLVGIISGVVALLAGVMIFYILTKPEIN